MSTNKIARLKDVAESANVSAAAVSRYLGGTLSLPADTASRIDIAVRKLDYRPNPHARSLSRGKSEVIGLVIPDIGNPFFAQLAAEIEKAAAVQGYGVQLCVTLNREERELEYIERFRRNHVDGLIFMTNHNGSRRLVRAINQAGHVVLVDEDITGTKSQKIFCDNENGGYLATRHLLEAGHRHVAFVGGPPRMLTTRERLAGYRRALREAGAAARNVTELFGNYETDYGRSSTEEILRGDARVTGIFFSSDEALLGGLETLKAFGVRIPDDMSAVTFDDVRPLHLFSTPITAVRQPLAEMGRRSVDAVLAQRVGMEAHPGVTRLPVSLVVRSSVAAPRRRAANLTK